MDTLIGVVIGILLSEWAWFAFALTALILDHNDLKFSATVTFTLLISGIVMSLGEFNLDKPYFIVGYFIGYMIVGFLWSAFRFKRYTANLILEYERINQPNSNDYNRLEEKIKVDLHGRNDNVEKIIYWVLVWPLSVASWLISDAMRWIITNVFGKLYNWIGYSDFKRISKPN